MSLKKKGDYMYVLNYQKQVERISQMIPLRKNEQTYEVYYHDPESGELWKSFFPYRSENKKGPKLLRPEPLPQNLKHQLEICLNSGNLADAEGLGIEYSLNPEKWDEILTHLEENRKKYSRRGFFEFLKFLGVKDSRLTLEALKIDFGQLSLSEKEIYSLKKRARMLSLKKFFGI
ncbi:MAG: hypothetical protein ABJR05_03765 [Balneola sp.]